MKYIAALLLFQLANPGALPTAKDFKKILKAADVEADEERITALLEAVGEKDIATIIAEGSAKIGSVGVGGGGGASGGAAAAPATAAGGAAAAAPAKAEEKEEEEDDDMGFGLFD